MRVTVVVCTRDRPAGLRALAASLGRSRFRRAPVPDVELLVVENGPNRSASRTDLEALTGWPVRIVHEPRPGVAPARNAALAHRDRSADWLLSVDDDQTVAPSWLDHHLAVAASTDADVLTGPVLVRLPPDAPGWVSALWRNVPRHPTGTGMPSFAGGNVCFRGDLFDRTGLRYDERHGRSTADDADLGRRLRQAGHLIRWNDRAVCWEPVPEERLRTRWLVERFLSYGGFASVTLRREHGWGGVLRAAPDELRHLGRGLAAVRRLGRDPEATAETVVELAHTAGWIAGLTGWRIADYRTVTPAAVIGAPAPAERAGAPRD